MSSARARAHIRHCALKRDIFRTLSLIMKNGNRSERIARQMRYVYPWSACGDGDAFLPCFYRVLCGFTRRSESLMEFVWRTNRLVFFVFFCSADDVWLYGCVIGTHAGVLLFQSLVMYVRGESAERVLQLAAPAQQTLYVSFYLY